MDFASILSIYLVLIFSSGVKCDLASETEEGFDNASLFYNERKTSAPAKWIFNYHQRSLCLEIPAECPVLLSNCRKDLEISGLRLQLSELRCAGPPRDTAPPSGQTECEKALLVTRECLTTCRVQLETCNSPSEHARSLSKLAESETRLQNAQSEVNTCRVQLETCSNTSEQQHARSLVKLAESETRLQNAQSEVTALKAELDAKISKVSQSQVELTQCRSSLKWQNIHDVGLVIEIRGHTYLFSKNQITWQAAMDTCQQIGMQLVSIETVEKQKQLLDAWQALGRPNSGTPHHWSSGNDIEQLGSYVWHSSGHAFSFTNWWASHVVTAYQRCVHMYLVDGVWGVVACSQNTFFVCEK